MVKQSHEVHHTSVLHVVERDELFGACSSGVFKLGTERVSIQSEDPDPTPLPRCFFFFFFSLETWEARLPHEAAGWDSTTQCVWRTRVFVWVDAVGPLTCNVVRPRVVNLTSPWRKVRQVGCFGISRFFLCILFNRHVLVLWNTSPTQRRIIVISHKHLHHALTHVRTCTHTHAHKSWGLG